MAAASEPEIVQRSAQPYAGIRHTVTMQTIAQVADGIGEIFDWLAEHDAEPDGAPFFRYNVIDMERELEVEAGIPVRAPVAGDDRVRAGMLPAGRYATLRYTGHPDGLLQATADLLAWADRQGLAFDVAPSLEGERWGCRIEIYETDPVEEPDMDKWTTQLAFRLAD